MPYTDAQRRLFHAKAKDKKLSPKKRAEYARLAAEADRLLKGKKK